MAGQDYRHAGGDCRHHLVRLCRWWTAARSNPGAPRNAVFHRPGWQGRPGRPGAGARVWRRPLCRTGPASLGGQSLNPARRGPSEDTMQDIQLLLEQYGAWLVFGNVLIEQAGLPVPAYPMLIAAGALAGGGLAGVDRGHAGLPAGRQPLVPGGPALRFAPAGRGLQAVALAGFLHPPDAAAVPASACARCWCVPAGRGRAVHRHGRPDGTGLRRFLLYDLVGAMIWAGSALLLGGLFHGVVNDVLDLLANYGAMGLACWALLALYRRRALRRWCWCASCA